MKTLAYKVGNKIDLFPRVLHSPRRIMIFAIFVRDFLQRAHSLNARINRGEHQFPAGGTGRNPSPTHEKSTH